jgi:hypothetical protein
MIPQEVKGEIIGKVSSENLQTSPKIKEHMIRGQSIMPLPSDSIKEDKTEHFSDEHVKQTISDFPEPYCPGNQYEPTYISETLLTYSLDERTKPYEEYIRELSPSDSLKLIQSNNA